MVEGRAEDKLDSFPDKQSSQLKGQHQSLIYFIIIISSWIFSIKFKLDQHNTQPLYL